MKIPEGWPTEEMIKAAVNTPHGGHASPLMYWKKMLQNVFAAAPTPPAQEDEPVAVISTWSGGLSIDLIGGRKLPAGTKLYTRPQSDKLRDAAAELLDALSSELNSTQEAKNLHNALEETK